MVRVVFYVFEQGDNIRFSLPKFTYKVKAVPTRFW